MADIITHNTNQLVILVEGEARADSRLICQKLSIAHGPFLTNIIRKYQKDFEQFGHLHFQNGKPNKQGGRPELYVLLNEDQTNLALTYVRNTEEARVCKIDLIKAFSFYKQQVQQPKSQAELALMHSQILVDQERRLANLESRLDNTPISIDGQKEGHLHSLLSSYGRRIGNYSVGYNKFYEHYKIGSYKQLPLRLYPEAIELVESWHDKMTLGENRLF